VVEMSLFSFYMFPLFKLFKFREGLITIKLLLLAIILAKKRQIIKLYSASQLVNQLKIQIYYSIDQRAADLKPIH
jgi:hypothetical protein